MTSGNFRIARLDSNRGHPWRQRRYRDVCVGRPPSRSGVDHPATNPIGSRLRRQCEIDCLQVGARLNVDCARRPDICHARVKRVAQRDRNLIAIRATDQHGGHHRRQWVGVGGLTAGRQVITAWRDPVDPVFSAVVCPHRASTLVGALPTRVVRITQQLHQHVDQRLV